MHWAACTLPPPGGNEEHPVLTDEGLDRLVADIVQLALEDELLEETPTGALTVPLTRRPTPRRHPENHINLGH
jgi:hypothetical protein